MGRVVLLFLACCLLSCSGRVDTSTANEVAASERSCPGMPSLDSTMLPADSVNSARQIFLVSAKRFGDTEASLSHCLGAPLEVTIDTVTNIHTDEQDNILHITYAGIRYSIYRVLADGKEILFRVEAFAPTDELAFGIRVGVPWSLVLQRLGTPTGEEQSSPGTLVAYYLIEGFVQETVTFRAENGVVSEIDWDYYID